MRYFHNQVQSHRGRFREPSRSYSNRDLAFSSIRSRTLNILYNLYCLSGADGGDMFPSLVRIMRAHGRGWVRYNAATQWLQLIMQVPGLQI